MSASNWYKSLARWEASLKVGRKGLSKEWHTKNKPPRRDAQRYATTSQRVLILSRDGYACRYCGVPVTFTTARFDHVISHYSGGQTLIRNLVTSCNPCNRAKGYRYAQPSPVGGPYRDPFGTRSGALIA